MPRGLRRAGPASGVDRPRRLNAADGSEAVVRRPDAVPRAIVNPVRRRGGERRRRGRGGRRQRFDQHAGRGAAARQIAAGHAQRPSAVITPSAADAVGKARVVLLAGGKDGRVTSASAVASAARIHYRPPVSHVSKAPHVSDLVYERMDLIVAVFATQWAAGRVNPGKARFGRGLPRLPPRRRRFLSRFHAAECRKRRLSNLFRSGPQARLRCARSNARRSGIHGARA